MLQFNLKNMPTKLNKFELILVASQRSKDLNFGVSSKFINYYLHKDIIISLKEISLRLINIDRIKKFITNKIFIRKYNKEN